VPVRSVLMVVVSAISLLGGCAAPQPTGPTIQHHYAHLVFNPPAGANLPTYYYQSDWPSTEAYEVDGEAVYYQETVQDIQFRQLGRDDLPYRRFTSVRVGRAYR
jgi:hypothetical protein